MCTGNICRSPTAHALLQQKAQAMGLWLLVDSAGISDEEAGRPMDARSARELVRRGHAPLAHRARQIKTADFLAFDHLIGMTRVHCASMARLREQAGRRFPGRSLGEVGLMLDWLPGQPRGQDVPDPWYGGPADFVRAFELIDEAVDALLAQLQA
ncbi:low molecular weight protein-tyrosine-phosphatase [Corticibacter populi]|uniref:low molecular weight protein-tyrosine-phosphatase n=1 Tax=Corticibacter populi TaxID=1550736 RepID=UPI001FD05A8F|nr:low molecular weight protein-tyrosine-phosphatase [Corticibacter populi]